MGVPPYHHFWTFLLRDISYGVWESGESEQLTRTRKFILQQTQVFIRVLSDVLEENSKTSAGTKTTNYSMQFWPFDSFFNQDSLFSRQMARNRRGLGFEAKHCFIVMLDRYSCSWRCWDLQGHGARDAATQPNCPGFLVWHQPLEASMISGVGWFHQGGTRWSEERSVAVLPWCDTKLVNLTKWQPSCKHFETYMWAHLRAM